ncbi:hypothetical protein [Brumimicrobium oceani]|uniref:Uncharacterized protein n=1 Tax=Brumimicrobium oceani TaxID=2100725 RepID=A0A2U2X0S9_9FLAO|nr:hypothetical protein [Brumimicrobium oceani]PWH81383.1 hypothetical protein DIT68_15255 [Brumimicrobium oceani]
MKHNFLQLILLLFSFTLLPFSKAQNIEVHIGNETKAYKKERIISVHHADDGIIVLKEQLKLLGKGRQFLEIFDEDMNFVSRNELELPDKDLEFSLMRYLNGNIYLFMEKQDSRNRINTAYGTIITRDAKFESEIYELVQFEYERRKRINSFDISISADSTSFLIETTPPQIDKEQMASRHFLIIDQDFKEVDNITIDFPFKERDFGINRTHLDAKGNLHMLTSVAIEESKRNTIFRTAVETEARVFTLYKGESDVQEYIINFLNDDAGFISQIQMKTDDLGRLQCAGFYSDTKGNSTRGVFVFTIDPETKEISNVNSQEFTDEYLEQFLTDRQVRKKNRKQGRDSKNNRFERLYYYKVRDIVMKKGGGFYMVAEYYLHTVTTTTNANGTVTYTNRYYYNDLMVISVLEDNSVDWYSKVAKKQYSINDDGIYSGIVTGINDDNSLNIIYNDNNETSNILVGDNIKALKLKKSKVVLVKFEEDGTASKTPLFGDKKSKVYLVPSASPKGKQNNLVLYSKGKKKNRFTNVILR